MFSSSSFDHKFTWAVEPSGQGWTERSTELPSTLAVESLALYVEKCTMFAVDIVNGYGYAALAVLLMIGWIVFLTVKRKMQWEALKREREIYKRRELEFQRMEIHVSFHTPLLCPSDISKG